MKLALTIAQIILGVMLTLAILFQPSEGQGLSSAIAAGGEHYHTRRGIERALFVFTIVGIVLFSVLSILSTFIQA
jgi:protein translocase SecG subunit